MERWRLGILFFVLITLGILWTMRNGGGNREGKGGNVTGKHERSREGKGERKERREEEDPWVTKQRCHTLADESEFCEYQGPMCLSDQIVYVSSLEGKQDRDERIMASSTDFRFFERTTHLSYQGPFIRQNPPIEGIIEQIQDGELPTLILQKEDRAWGPHTRIISVSDIPRNALVKAFLESNSSSPSLSPPLSFSFNFSSFSSSFSSSYSLPASWRRAAARTPKKDLDKLPPPGTKFVKDPPAPWLQQAVMPEKITWLEGAMYVVPLAPAWDFHLWHFSSAALQMFAIKRENISSPTSYAQRGKIHLPPIDYLVFPGAYTLSQDTSYWASWIQMLMPFFTQSHTKILTNGALATDQYRTNSTHWLCSTKGVLTGVKTRFFTGNGDAYAFRAAAYAMAAVNVTAWPNYPPRKITIVDRVGGSRSFYNRGQMEAILEATGLPYEFVSFSGDGIRQIQKMSETGIFIAAHGNGGTNAIFLPAHSVMIEVFPYLWFNPAFKNLALSSDCHYISVHSSKPPEEEQEMNPSIKEAFHRYYTEEFIKECEESHMDDLESNVSQCNTPVKNSPIWVPLEEFQLAVRNALLMIGCRNGVCAT